MVAAVGRHPRRRLAVLVGIDQGTSGTAVVAYDDLLKPIARAYRPLRSRRPLPGRVEQDPDDIVETIVEAVAQVQDAIGSQPIDAAGVANQGETVVAWDRESGRALGPAIVWSDRRGEELADRLRAAGQAPDICATSGLRLDAYFSAAKYGWLLEHDPAVRRSACAATLSLGTTESWLRRRLGDGRYLSDRSTASRTQLLGLHSGAWEPALLRPFGVPERALAEVVPCLCDWGDLHHPSWRTSMPWRASLVDQPAALAGNGAMERGSIKVTYGTGCFCVLNAGGQAPEPDGDLLASVAWSDVATTTYALDGGIFSASSALQWLEQMGILRDAVEASDVALSVSGCAGVRFLPALDGLGAPWWDTCARGTLGGLSTATTGAHIVRAVLDAIAFRVRDVLEAFWRKGFAKPAQLPVDGGLTRNDYLMQRQADVLGLPVARAADHEATALGAAALAGASAGVLALADLAQLARRTQIFDPRLSADQRDAQYERWLAWLALARRSG
ncbi:MAG: FGGY family carbohydrate kinase [Candidatus Eremiobacteraeota bacterium]|nr:FGGY family carbohydrate kinase [Candidatus Eremiobacteraeota bacterium]